MHTQQALPLALPAASESLIIGESNQLAYHMMHNIDGWSYPLLCLVGASQSGKTLLLQQWLGQHDGMMLSADLAAADIAAIRGGCYALDNITIESHEESLLHVVNMVIQHGGRLAIAMHQPPSHVEYQLADLGSRMKAAQVAHIMQPDETMLEMLLVKLLSYKQLRVDHTVMQFVIKRMPRSFAAATMLVDIMDRLSLQHQRAITQHLAKDALAALTNVDLS